MKNYITGNYWIKFRSRGPIKVNLTSIQAESFFDLVNKLEIEFIKLENAREYNENKYFTSIKGNWFDYEHENSLALFNSI